MSKLKPKSRFRAAVHTIIFIIRTKTIFHQVWKNETVPPPKYTTTGSITSALRTCSIFTPPGLERQVSMRPEQVTSNRSRSHWSRLPFILPSFRLSFLSHFPPHNHFHHPSLSLYLDDHCTLYSSHHGHTGSKKFFKNSPYNISQVIFLICLSRLSWLFVLWLFYLSFFHVHFSNFSLFLYVYISILGHVSI